MKKFRKFFSIFFIGVLVLAPFSSIESMESENYVIEKDSINFAGTDGSESENYILSDSVGEIATGETEQKCSSLSFDGSNDYASVPQALINGKSAATLSLWFKTTDSDGGMIDQYSMSSSYGYTVNIDGGKVKSCISTTSRACYTTFSSYDVSYDDVSANDGLWHNAITTYDGSFLKLYVDGIERDSIEKLGNVSYFSVYGSFLGLQGFIQDSILYPQGDARFNGSIDDARVYERAFSEAEVQDLYNGNDVDSTGLKARWNFNEGSGTTIYDSSGNGKNGTLINGPVFSDSYPEGACEAYLMNAGYREMDENYIAISSPSDIVMSPAIGGISGGIGNGTATWTVTTDNSAGYQVSIKSSAAPALQSGSYVFADYTPAVVGADFSWLIDSSDSEFGYTVEGADAVNKFLDNGSACGTGSGNTEDRCWVGLSTADESIINSSSPNHPLGSDAIIKFQAESGSGHLQEEGTYTATIVVTAVAL